MIFQLRLFEINSDMGEYHFFTFYRKTLRFGMSVTHRYCFCGCKKTVNYLTIYFLFMRFDFDFDYQDESLPF